MSVLAADPRDPLDEEDEARASLYALLARLFWAPPDPELLQGMAEAVDLGAEEGMVLARAWSDLKGACAAESGETVREEYEALFVGTGKAEVTPYLGAYVPRSVAPRFLVELRTFLAAQGLARREAVSEPEDHVASVLEVMRHLIAEARADVPAQKAFFETSVATGTKAFCEAVIRAPRARLYKAVARLALSFVEVEEAAFDIA